MPISPNSKSEVVWISPQETLPDICCTCGMYTDRRVTVKHVSHTQVWQAGESGGVTLIRILSIFLGPIGWLVSAMVTEDDQEKLKTVKQKSKIKISQCLLCSGMGLPKVLNSVESPKRFAFLTHPEFKKRIEQVQLDARKQQKKHKDGYSAR